MSKRGRPYKNIDKAMFEKLCGLLMTKKEICGFFFVSDKTLDNWCRRTYQTNFSDIYSKKSVYGKIRLRQYQLQLAEKDPEMAIFLGKNWLGQSASPDNSALWGNEEWQKQERT